MRSFLLVIIWTSALYAGDPTCRDFVNPWVHAYKGPILRGAIPANVEKLRKWMKPGQFILEPGEVESFKTRLGVTTDELLIDLMLVARDYARPPISKYHVGEAGLAGSGRVYLGINVEYPGHPLFQTIHGEQFLVAALLLHGETSAVAFAMDGAPCGHCRQFMWEMHGAENLRILNPHRPAGLTLPMLLPDPFGPQDLGVGNGLLTHEPKPKKLIGRVPPGLERLAETARVAAEHAYAPYSSSAGIAMEMSNGAIYRGFSVDNAAFNPSLPAFQMATVDMLMNGGDFDQIRRVVLVEDLQGPKSEVETTRMLIRKAAPQAEFEAIPCR